MSARKSLKERIEKMPLNLRFIRKLFGAGEKEGEWSQEHPLIYYIPVSPECRDNEISVEAMTEDLRALQVRGLINITTAKDGDLYPTFASSPDHSKCCLRFRTYEGGTASLLTHSGLLTLLLAMEIHHRNAKLEELRVMAENQLDDPAERNPEGLMMLYKLLSRQLSTDVEAWLMNKCMPRLSGTEEIRRTHDDHDGTYYGKMILRFVSKHCVLARTDMICSFNHSNYEEAEKAACMKYEALNITKGWVVIRKPAPQELNYIGKLAVWNAFCVLGCLMLHDPKTPDRCDVD